VGPTHAGPPVSGPTADFLVKASRACRRALHGEQGNTSWGWAQRSTEKKNPAMAWLGLAVPVAPSTPLFASFCSFEEAGHGGTLRPARYRIITARSRYGTINFSPGKPVTLKPLSLSDQWEMDV